MTHTEARIMKCLAGRRIGMTKRQIQIYLSDVPHEVFESHFANLLDQGFIEEGSCGRWHRYYETAAGSDAASWFMDRNSPNGGW